MGEENEMSIDIAVMTDVTRNADVDDYPRPPSLHWALVLVFWILTGGLFKFIWMYRQAAWVRRIDPSSKALWVLAAGFAGGVGCRRSRSSWPPATAR
jgi:hypothetical protein